MRPQPQADMRLRGRRLVLARAAWIVIAMLALGLFVVSIPARYEQLRRVSAAATARDETDLDRLTARLVEVVQETMQPEHVSLWLKPTAGGGHWSAVGGRRRAEERTLNPY